VSDDPRIDLVWGVVRASREDGVEDFDVVAAEILAALDVHASQQKFNHPAAFEAIKRDRNAWREESLRARMALAEIARDTLVTSAGPARRIARDALAVALPPEVEW
jgi:hypothetical protein